MNDSDAEGPNDETPNNGSEVDANTEAPAEDVETDHPVGATKPGADGLPFVLNESVMDAIARSVAPFNESVMDAIARAVAPLNESAMDAIARAVAPFSESVMASIARSVAPLNESVLNTLTATTHNLVPLLPDITLIKLPKFDLPNLPDFRKLFEQLRDALPPNWSEDIDEERALVVVQDEGIPLVWIPRAEVVDKLLAADDRSARLAMLVECRSVILDDCRKVLAETTEDTLSGQVPLARAAVNALVENHSEAAQALSVVVTETAIARAIDENYARVKRHMLLDPKMADWNKLRLHAALAPIGRFYTDWHWKSGRPQPVELSRHVSVHHADATHYTEVNAIIAVMLVTSVLRALQELQELEVAAEEDDAA